MLSITPLIGCRKSENNVSEFDEMARIYSYGNTYLSLENRQKYKFFREDIRVVDCSLGTIIIIYNASNCSYAVSETIFLNHECYIYQYYISGYTIDFGLNKFKCRYLPLEDFLTDEEKGKDAFYIEELVEIQKRIDEKNKELVYSR